MRLIAIRAQIDALIAEAGGEVQPVTPENCPHPEAERKYLTFARTSFKCEACGQVVMEP